MSVAKAKVKEVIQKEMSDVFMQLTEDDTKLYAIHKSSSIRCSILVSSSPFATSTNILNKFMTKEPMCTSNELVVLSSNEFTLFLSLDFRSLHGDLFAKLATKTAQNPSWLYVPFQQLHFIAVGRNAIPNAK